jgi:hypothetical protein
VGDPQDRGQRVLPNHGLDASDESVSVKSDV